LHLCHPKTRRHDRDRHPDRSRRPLHAAALAQARRRRRGGIHWNRHPPQHRGGGAIAMLDQQTVERLAQRLDEAERSKSLITAFTREYPDLTIEDAYAIQRAWTKLQLSRGRVVKGHKIGLTSKAMQNAVGISEPDYGVLFADMFYSDASPIPFDRFHAPRIEVELAFVLKAPLKGPGCTLFDVLNATDYVTPALEILETRMHRIDPETKAARNVMDTIADNAANA